MKKKKETVLVLCAHNDDHVLGCGGTIAKYSKEGIDVVIIIFSYGETSHLWLKRNESIKMRVSESRKADKVLGIEKTYYYGLQEGHFAEDIQKNKLFSKLKRTINILKPTKIFTHSFDDPHPDHRDVYKISTNALDEIKHKCDMYSFDIWNPFNFRKRDSPKMVVDITDTYKAKMRSFKLHKSQWAAKSIMYPATFFRAILNGLDRGFRYAEVFYKLR